MTGLFIAMLFTGFFAWLFVRAYQFGMKSRHEHLIYDSRTLKFFVSFAVLGALVCYYLLRQYRFIYYWDYGGYWTQSFTLMKELFTYPATGIIKSLHSILYSEYNKLLPMIIALPLKIFGYTFTRYVLVNYICFLVPVCFILASLVKNKLNHNYGLFALFMAFTFTPFYRAMLVGYIDIACLVPASIALILMNDYDAKSFSREQIKRDVYISLMLVLTLMFRRYFVFYVIGYMSALGLLSLYQIRKNFALIKNAALNIIVIGLAALIIMSIFCGPILFQRLMTTYSDIYIAWNAPLIQKINTVIDIYGWFAFILASIAVILSLITGHMRRYVMFCAVSVMAASASFFHIQAMGIHQIYILAPQLFILSCSGVILAAKVIKSRKFIPALCVLIFSAGYANCFFPSVRPALSNVSRLFGSVHNNLIRNDIHVLNELVDYVNSLTKDNNKKVYTFNFGTLSAMGKPDKPCPLKRLLGYSDIDLRDGYPASFLSADIVINTLSSTDRASQAKGGVSQREVVHFNSQEITKADSPIGRHFRKNERSFTLDGGITAYIYEKQSEFEDSDLHYIADYFTKLYPGREKIFADRIFNYNKPKPELINRKSFVENNRPLVVQLVKWALKNKLASPEHLAEFSHRKPQEFYELMRK
ncbi:MAG: hypothetical protein IJP48_04680 [Synergistaceae bacterium]|nr:hypothetical protein [Synergistaceae bacterium]